MVACVHATGGVNFDVLRVTPFYHGVVGPRRPSNSNVVLLRLRIFIKEKLFRAAGKLRRIFAA
jgi:hypothetical protein